MKCPHCQQALADNPALAGQIVKCPLCGGKFGLSGNVAEPPLPTSFQPSPRRDSSVKSEPRSRIKALMLAATAVYMVIVVSLFSYCSFSMAAADAKIVADAKKDYAKEMRHYKKLPGGGYMDSRSGDLYSESGMDRIREIYAPRPNPAVGLSVGAMYCALPTVIYFVAIGVLVVIHFAGKN